MTESSPANRSANYATMAPRWSLLNAVIGGTETMRAAAQSLLPIYEAETEKSYKARLNGAVLANYLELTLNSLSGKPFSEPMKLVDVPKALAPVLDDVDLCGNSLEVFARSFFREGLLKGFSIVMVDSPRAGATDGPRTIADDREQNLRPYAVKIAPENVIALYSDMVGGVEMIIHMRVVEYVREIVGFDEVTIKQIRVLTPGNVAIYREDKQDSDKWVLVDSWETGLAYVPVVVYYTTRDGAGLCKPPLLDLAYLNVAHWQSTSDQRRVLSISRFPILAATGVDSDNVLKLAPNSVLYTSENGKYYYVEHSGAAIESGRLDLKDLEESMAAYGASFLTKKSGTQTATARALDSSESSCDLSAMTIAFEDALAQMLYMFADWYRMSGFAGRVELVKNYTITESDRATITALKDMRSSRDISRKAYVAEMKAMGVLSEEYDEEADAEELRVEAMEIGAVGDDLDPQQVDDQDDGEAQEAQA